MRPRDLPERLADIPVRLARFLPRTGIASLASGIEFMSLWRWTLLSMLVGLVTGLAAAGVFWVLHWGESLLVARIDTFEGPLEEAFPPLSVTLVLADHVDVARGDMICRRHNQPQMTRDLRRCGRERRASSSCTTSTTRCGTW